MIDDEDSKVRRNLVVICAAVIAVTFLEVQPVRLIQDALKLPDMGVAPWKAWTIVLVLLVYLYLRFEKLTTGIGPDERPRQSWRSVWRARRSHAIESYAKRAVSSSLIRSKRGAHGIFSDQSPLDCLLQESQTVPEFIAFERISVSGYARKGGDPEWSGHVPFDVSVRVHTGEVLPWSHKRSQVKVFVGWPHRGVIMANMTLQSVLTTDAGLRHVAPRVLAMIAAACICWQFARILINLMGSGVV